MNKNHTKGIITPCEQCDEKFVTAYERNNHMKEAHGTPMAYIKGEMQMERSSDDDDSYEDSTSDIPFYY